MPHIDIPSHTHTQAQTHRQPHAAATRIAPFCITVILWRKYILSRFLLLCCAFHSPPRPSPMWSGNLNIYIHFFRSSFSVLLLLLPPSCFISAVVLPKENLLPSKLQCVARTIKQSAHFHWQHNKTGLARALACCSRCLTSLSPFSPYSFTCPFLVLLPFWLLPSAVNIFDFHNVWHTRLLKFNTITTHTYVAAVGLYACVCVCLNVCVCARPAPVKWKS